MFNAPRLRGPQNLSSSAFFNTSTSLTSNATDPLAQSMPAPSSGYGDVDPWSTVNTPTRIETPRRDSIAEEAVPQVGNTRIGNTNNPGLDGLINDPPPLYLTLYDSLSPPSSGLIPLSSVHRLLSTSKLPASTIEHVISLTSQDRSAITRSELFCAFALIALAQDSGVGEEVSVERLEREVQGLGLPRLEVGGVGGGGVGGGGGYSLPDTPGIGWGGSGSGLGNVNVNGRGEGSGFGESEDQVPSGFKSNGNGGGAIDAEIEAERGYWKRMEKIEVSLIPEKEGWFLQKYRIESDKRSGEPVSRRYSDFVWLSDCLLKRYPFRLLPSLPPKRIGPDASFLEQRRKALQRFLNHLTSHPVTKTDGALNVFLTEPNFSSWRKRTPVSTEEESTSKKLTTAQEMGIPGDLDAKLGVLREGLPGLLGSYAKLVGLGERMLARLMAGAADAARVGMGLGTISEGLGGCCWRNHGEGGGCGLCNGVGRGLRDVGESWTRVAEANEKRAAAILAGNIEALKTQRDLYFSFRDLFIRHDKLSKDSVDALRKKVETRNKKVESLRSAKKAGWDMEVEKLNAATDVDNITINNLLSRRVFIKACMWHELAVVFHSRQAAQATLGWRAWAAEEAESSRGVVQIWESLGERLRGMPVE